MTWGVMRNVEPMQNNSRKRVLVTGADGFIGSHLTEILVKKGYSVRAFVYYNSFNSWGWLDDTPPDLLKNIEIFSGDVRDPHGVKKAMEGCEAALHLAALISIPFSYHSPDAYIDTNIKGTLNVLQAARDLGNLPVIHTSTSEVYGTALRVPIDEDHPLQGQSPYSASKIGADQLALSFYRSFELPVTVVRPFNTFGPRQSARAIIPTIITQLAKGAKKIKLGSLTPTRDFTLVTDTCLGFIAALENSPFKGEVINLGSGFEISIGDLGRTIGELMNVDVTVEEDAQRLRPKNSEVERLLSDNTLAKKIINWQPRVGGMEGLKQGLNETIQWFCNSENLKSYKPEVYNI